MSKKVFITTPLYYVNSKPHIGHSYTQIAADTLARYYRLTGHEVLFLTGTDEHGQKVEKAATAAGLPAKEFTDRISQTFRQLWKTLDVSYDDFIRTTEARHIQTVQAVWVKLNASGEIYKSTYSGLYCTPCESFWLESQVLSENSQKLCPDCRRPVETLKEDNYFLKLGKHQAWLMQYIREHKEFIRPEIRRNEVIGFLENNTLQDLCISRPKSRLAWGIESPLSDQHVTYVWFDALINYISACGWSAEPKAFEKWWPADVQFIGKDILRHHAVYWPILLKALDIPLPRTVFAHGWWVQGGQKMSKSLGNVTDPVELVKMYGVDAYRYFLLREVPFGSDGTFSEEALTLRYNTDLANDLGNLLHRTLTMTEKYFEGVVPAGVSLRCRGGLRDSVDSLTADLIPLMNRLAFSEALGRIWQVVTIANRSIEERAPWKLAKEGKTEELQAVIVELIESLKVVAQAIWPIMPRTAQGVWAQLGLSGSPESTLFASKLWGFFEKGGKIAKGSPLFPRIETEKTS